MIQETLMYFKGNFRQGIQKSDRLLNIVSDFFDQKLRNISRQELIAELPLSN